MATFFGSPPILSHPPTRNLQLSSSSQTPPPPPSQPSQPPPPSPQVISTSSSEQQPRPVTARPAETTDWIASTLTRRFGLGAGLAWAAFLAVGVVSEQIKTRIEVSQQQANTRSVALAIPF